MQINVTVTGDKDLKRGLEKMGKSLYMWDSAMREIGKEVKDFFANDVMNSQGGAIGEKWRPLNPKYALYKATGHTTTVIANQRKRKMGKNVNVYPGAGILRASGKMAKSFVYTSNSNSATVTNTAPQFKYHQSSAAREKLPRRVMMKDSPQVKSIVATIVNNDVRQKLKAAGF